MQRSLSLMLQFSMLTHMASSPVFEIALQLACQVIERKASGFPFATS